MTKEEKTGNNTKPSLKEDTKKAFTGLAKEAKKSIKDLGNFKEQIEANKTDKDKSLKDNLKDKISQERKNLKKNFEPLQRKNVEASVKKFASDKIHASPALAAIAQGLGAKIDPKNIIKGESVNKVNSYVQNKGKPTGRQV